VYTTENLVVTTRKVVAGATYATDDPGSLDHEAPRVRATRSGSGSAVMMFGGTMMSCGVS
jgi:hypothetical protein